MADKHVVSAFHPAVAGWFEARFGSATPAQERAWPLIQTGHNVLIAAPTGSGKTLAAFLACIDALVRRGVRGALPEKTQVLYVSPLKALSTDIHDNLEAPLAGIAERLEAAGTLYQPVTAAVRTGDTPAAARDKMRRRPPHILVTTPESLFILLTSESGRAMLSGVGSVIVDEIHALAGSKRGAHLLLSLARLDALTGRPAVRIGLSATQKPIEAMAEFLCHRRPCEIIDTGHQRERDLRLEVTGSPLTPIMSNEAWAEIYDRLAALIAEHGTTLVFVNTRRLTERASRHLGERLGEEAVMAHHGSLAREHRLEAEQRLKAGKLKAMVATASLELGIDIGDVDLVCQLGSPRSIAGFVQRVGRSGHAVGAVPKGRLFPLSLDDLVECAALIHALNRGELDRIGLPRQPLDVLAQQIVAEVAGREWDEAELFETLRANRVYRDLSCEAFDQVVAMLAAGFSTRRGRRSAYLHRDQINGKLRARRGARLTALMNAGTIPDQFDYDVYLRPQDLKIGTLNEDFAFESVPGDIFQLGNTSYRILKVQTGRVLVEDARGQPPNIPFWFGEAPGRSEELSDAVSRLRAEAQRRLDAGEDLRPWLTDEYALPTAAAAQLGDYLAMAHAALGRLPTRDCLVLERFFDETSDMHVVLHAPYGSRLNRALGLSLRKRFCRKFNFELQAAALEDSLVLSLGPTHSFPLDEVIGYLNADSVRDVLIQALLDAPMFATRWRWAATVSLAVKRMSSAGKRPPQFQRSDAEDLVAVVFPDQLACQENLGGGAREIPDHPLVRQAIDDCLHEVMDVDGLERLLADIAAGAVRVETRDLVHPSPLAQEILNARPYAFLDDGAAEERRTANVRSLPNLSLAEAGSLATLDPEVIASVREQAWIDARDEDEMHDALLVAGFLTAAEVDAREPDDGLFGWPALLSGLEKGGRAVRVRPTPEHALWVATERLHEVLALYPGLNAADLPAPLAAVPEPEAALVELLRSRLEVLGPVTVAELQAQFAVPAGDLGVALVALEGEGMAVRGRFEGAAEQWCNRRLLARIHQGTLRGRRRRYRPVDPARFMGFLFRSHGMIEREGAGRASLEQVLKRLQGVAAPARAWEAEILPGRMQTYHGHWLDELCAGGRYAWLRLRPSEGGGGGASVLGQTPVAILERPGLIHWLPPDPPEPASLSANAGRLLAVLADRGASFSGELAAETGLLEAQLEQGLAELVAAGLVASDSFQGIRHLAIRLRERERRARYRKRGYPTPGLEEAGRWALVRRPAQVVDHWARCEYLARALLDRYGVLFRALVAAEPGLPPWRDLLYVCRRLEAREELAGGRFVDGFSGEQFALPGAAGQLRKPLPENTWVVISASDPLNLTGLITPGERVPAVKSNRIAYRDGVPVAALVGGEIRALGEVELSWELRQRLIRERGASLHPPRRPATLPRRPFRH